MPNMPEVRSGLRPDLPCYEPLSHAPAYLVILAAAFLTNPF